MSKAFEWSRPVEFYETDLAGMAHFSNFYRWMEAAEHAFLSSLGVDFSVPALGFPRVNASADFKKPIRFGDLLRVSVEVFEVRNSAICYRFEIRVNDHDDLCATGEMTTVCVDAQTTQPIPIPQEMREKISL